MDLYNSSSSAFGYYVLAPLVGMGGVSDARSAEGDLQLSMEARESSYSYVMLDLIFLLCGYYWDESVADPKFAY